MSDFVARDATLCCSGTTHTSMISYAVSCETTFRHAMGAMRTVRGVPLTRTLIANPMRSGAMCASCGKA